MADLNAIAEQTRSGWHGFARFLLLATGAIVIALGLMAIFLL